MKVKISDYIAQYLVSKGITYNFTVPGGGAMHLNVSFGHQEGMHNIFMQHEQGAAMAAEGFCRVNNELPLVCVTTGPGGTNALTGVLGAWLDSIPMLVISGQVRYDATVRSTGYPMRTYGDQEFDIAKTVSGMTKYAEMITVPRMVKYHIDKALYLACHGRPGPVWLDIPQNIQSAYIDPADFVEFDESEMKNTKAPAVSGQVVRLILDKIQAAERPVLLAGYEIRTTGSYETFLKLIDRLNIPVVTSYESIDLLPENHPLYAGRAGDMGNRYGNWTVQNSDMLLVIGSRLGVRQVSHATDTWARKAFVAMVHEDPAELLKPGIHVEMPVRAENENFMQKMIELLDSSKEDFQPKQSWFERIALWKEKYPVVDRQRHYQDLPRANVYCFINELSEAVPEGTIVVSGNGSACVVGGSSYKIKQNQRYILNSAAASMGYDLPAAVGACFANGCQSMVCLTGDGSIQMNLQELQTIVFHRLPIKIFVINNEGYHSMRQTQDNLFRGQSKVGVGPETADLSFPDMEKIASAYGMPYMAIHNNREMTAGLREFLGLDGYAMCEVFVDTAQAFEPKPTAKKLQDGRLVSPPLEDLAPFLPREELKDIMLIPLVDEQ